MKTKWSALFSLALLLSLVGCGAEQFGSVPQSTTSNPDPIRVYEQLSCSSHTLIKPKVDILYVFDNTQSYQFSQATLKQAVANTINQVSGEFDYRIVSTTLVKPLSGLDEYRVMTNSEDALPDPSKKVISSSELTNFFPLITQPHTERGLGRVQEFMNTYKNSLFRNGAYHFVVLISNSFDKDVEQGDGVTTSEVPGAWTPIYGKYITLKSNLDSKQFRFFSLTAKSRCKEGWRPSTHSYIKMANYLYASSGATDNNFYKDSYDLCSTSEVSAVFNAVNSSIKKVVVPHKYRYWPITFAENSTNITDLTALKVFKSNGSSAPVQITSGFTYKDNGLSAPDLNILTTTDPKEIVKGRRHFIEFANGSEPIYPDCIQVMSTSKTEYFEYIVLPREPIPNTIHVTIDGNVIPTSSWNYVGNRFDQNIKADYPDPGNNLPEVKRSGFMIQITNPTYYYQSGQNVQVNYLPAPI